MWMSLPSARPRVTWPEMGRGWVAAEPATSTTTSNGELNAALMLGKNLVHPNRRDASGARRCAHGAPQRANLRMVREITHRNASPCHKLVRFPRGPKRA